MLMPRAMAEQAASDTEIDVPTWLAREHEERRQRRGNSDVNYGAAEEQVPAEGWVT
jgi:hypothetical protein